MMRVRIESPDGLPEGTTITCVDVGVLHGVTAINISIEAGKPIRAQLALAFLEVGVVAEATTIMGHPVTGEIVGVRRIEFDDGTWWPPKKDM